MKDNAQKTGELVLGNARVVLPGEVMLPEALRPGDYLHFERLGAYSLAGRTRFNGHYSERIVHLGEA